MLSFLTASALLGRFLRHIFFVVAGPFDLSFPTFAGWLPTLVAVGMILIRFRDSTISFNCTYLPPRVPPTQPVTVALASLDGSGASQETLYGECGFSLMGDLVRIGNPVQGDSVHDGLCVIYGGGIDMIDQI